MNVKQSNKVETDILNDLSGLVTKEKDSSKSQTDLKQKIPINGSLAFKLCYQANPSKLIKNHKNEK